MRVAILYAGSISRGYGTSERVLQIADGLANLGAEVIFSGVIEDQLEASDSKDLQIISMPNRILKLPLIFKWIGILFSSGLTRKYDITQIESFSIPRSLALFLLMRPLTKKIVIVFHDKCYEDDPRKTAVGRLNLVLQRMLLTIFDASITPGLSVKKWFEELHDGFANKMVVIPNGSPDLNVKGDSDVPNLRKKYKIDPNAFVALFFGSMDFKPNHSAALYLYGISEFVSKNFENGTNKKLVFIVAGLGSEALPRTQYFVPLGFVNELNELFNLPDVIILPHTSSYSGPHVKTIYAFLSKKPVIASEDAVKDMPQVTAGKHFLQLYVNEPNSLLDSISKVYCDKEYGNLLASNASLYSKNFSWKYVSSVHLKFYEKLLNTK
jgi:hypothetical protein